MQTRYYNAAGFTIQVNSECSITPDTFHDKFRDFRTTQTGPDLVVINHFFKALDLSEAGYQDKKRVFKNDQWEIFKTKQAWIYRFRPTLPFEPGLPVTAVISPDHARVDVYISETSPEQYQIGKHNALTLFNSDQVLFSKLLCDRDGLILHSNGFQWAGKGFLLAGKSGSGKSTLSGMLKQRGFNILCDDRMFLRRLKSRFQIHGSWCHGSVPDAANRSAPLDALFFLRQSRQDKIELMTDKKTISRLMVQSMVKPFLDKEDWEKTLDTLSDLIRRTRIYTLYFNLSGSICGKIKEQLGQGGPEQQE